MNLETEKRLEELLEYQEEAIANGDEGYAEELQAEIDAIYIKEDMM